MYNGRARETIYQRGAGGRVIGMGAAGVEHVAAVGFVCRGVLIDAAGYKGVKRLPIPKTSSSPGVVTKADILGALRKQGTPPIKAGDCVFFDSHGVHRGTRCLDGTRHVLAVYYQGGDTRRNALVRFLVKGSSKT